MKFDISSFNEIAKPLLNTLAEQFPLPLQIDTKRYEVLNLELKTETGLLKATLHFLVQNNYLSVQVPTSGGVIVDHYLTSKGLALLNINFETEFNKTSSVYEQGKVGC